MIKIGTLILFVGTISLAFGDDPQKDPFDGVSSETNPLFDDIFKVFPDPSGYAYFPKGAESYYTKYLATMKEPSLLNRGDNRPPFEMRFLWLRSFHDPVCIRVWSTPDGHKLRAVRVKQNKDYSLGAILVDTTRLLNRSENESFTALLGAAPLTEPMNETEGGGGRDGAQWIFETHTKNKYNRINFWCLKEYGLNRYEEVGLDTSKIRDTPSLLRFALELLRLANIKIPEEETY